LRQLHPPDQCRYCFDAAQSGAELGGTDAQASRRQQSVSRFLGQIMPVFNDQGRGVKRDNTWSFIFFVFIVFIVFMEDDISHRSWLSWLGSPGWDCTWHETFLSSLRLKEISGSRPQYGMELRRQMPGIQQEFPFCLSVTDQYTAICLCWRFFFAFVPGERPGRAQWL
jgi:hypothetical protein